MWSDNENGTLGQHDFCECSLCPSAGSSHQELCNFLLELHDGAKKSIAKQILILKFLDISLHLTQDTFSPNGEEVFLTYSGEHVPLMNVNLAPSLQSMISRTKVVCGSGLCIVVTGQNLFGSPPLRAAMDIEVFPKNFEENLETSRGLNLRNLFYTEQTFMMEMRFTSKCPANEIIKKIEQAVEYLHFAVHKKNYKMSFQNVKSERKSNIDVATKGFFVDKGVILHDEGTVGLWDLSYSIIFEAKLGTNCVLASDSKLHIINDTIIISTRSEAGFCMEIVAAEELLSSSLLGMHT